MASKMNRGIYLNVFSPESNEKDMIDTAFEISKNYSKSFITEEKYEKLLKDLSKAVYKYKKRLLDSKDPNRYFHGTRDFYHLIKSVVRNILNKKECDLINEAFFSIESNYNGLLKNNECFSSKEIEREFIKNYSLENKTQFNKFDIIHFIRNNIKNSDNRYLLLITHSNLSQYLIGNILKENQDKKNIIYYLGSLFEEDIYNETYTSKQITKIRYYLSQEKILILKNLSTTYASLYDLFNQRFTYTLGKKYVEISIRDVSNYSLVNDSLRIIVLITKEALEHQDPPFINRFEKYIISFENLLNQNEKEIVSDLLKIKDLFKMLEGIKCNPENELINFYKEEINGLVLNSRFENKNKERNDEDYKKYVLSKITKTFPQELIIFLNVYRIEKKELVQKMNNYYRKTTHSNLKNYLTKIKYSKNIIYTFNSIIKIHFNFETNNPKYGIIKGEEIKHVLVKNIKSERDLETILDDFYMNQQIIFMIHFENNGLENLEFISRFIERIEKDKKEEEEIFNRYEKIGNLTDIKSIKESDLSKNYDEEGNKYYNEYKFISNIGSGSFSKIELVEKDGVKYAMKIIDKEFLKSQKNMEYDENGNLIINSSFENAFKEIAILKKMNHPNIIKLYEIMYCKKNKKIYLILEDCEHGDLMFYDDESNKFTVNNYIIENKNRKDKNKDYYTNKEIHKFLNDIISGIYYLHTNGIIHRDIKPNNILLDKDNNCKITDFNVSTILENLKDDKIGAKICSADHFRPPEACNFNNNDEEQKDNINKEKKKEDFRGKPIDIWALGVTAYILAYNKFPFE